MNRCTTILFGQDTWQKEKLHDINSFDVKAEKWASKKTELIKICKAGAQRQTEMKTIFFL